MFLSNKVAFGMCSRKLACVVIDIGMCSQILNQLFVEIVAEFVFFVNSSVKYPFTGLYHGEYVEDNLSGGCAR